MSCCLACGIRRPSRQYLCNACWYELSETTRTRLAEKTTVETERNRLFQLLSAIYRRVPLNRIEVAA